MPKFFFATHSSSPPKTSQFIFPSFISDKKSVHRCLSKINRDLGRNISHISVSDPYRQYHQPFQRLFLWQCWFLLVWKKREWIVDNDCIFIRVGIRGGVKIQERKLVDWQSRGKFLWVELEDSSRNVGTENKKGDNPDH